MKCETDAKQSKARNFFGKNINEAPLVGGLRVVHAFTNSWGGFTEFDAEFKFAKIQNSHLWGGSQNLMLSSNLLKSKIPICGGGVCRI